MSIHRCSECKAELTVSCPYCKRDDVVKELNDLNERLVKENTDLVQQQISLCNKVAVENAALAAVIYQIMEYMSIISGKPLSEMGDEIVAEIDRVARINPGRVKDGLFKVEKDIRDIIDG